MKEEGKGKEAKAMHVCCPLVGRGEQGECEDGVLEEEKDDDDDEEVVERRRTMIMIKMKWMRLVMRDTPTS